ncbi:MAG: S1 RNA-binding domain-containing protein, partial [Oscillospiraceae bacterium]|nr:S1 RNA-binding domain-containing protein [Oscillospiraceae bacterium]
MTDKAKQDMSLNGNHILAQAQYLPEGALLNKPENERFIESAAALQECMANGRTVEAICSVCDASHNLIIDFGFMKGIIPRNEGAIGIDDGSTRDIALISRVNKPICFKVTGFDNGTAILSRKNAQLECIERYINRLSPGDVISARITHLEQFGCFVDIGCGLPSLIPIDSISVSRISHPSDRFFIGQEVAVAVKSIDKNFA